MKVCHYLHLIMSNFKSFFLLWIFSVFDELLYSRNMSCQTAQNNLLVSANYTQCIKERKMEWYEYHLLTFYSYKIYDSCHHVMQHWQVTVNYAGDQVLYRTSWHSMANCQQLCLSQKDVFLKK